MKDDSGQDEREIRKLLDLVLCGSETDAEAEQLRGLLDSRPDLRDSVFEQLRMNSLLQWELSRSGASTAAEPEPLTQSRTGLGRDFARRVFWLACAASVAIAVAGISAFWASAPSISARQSFARYKLAPDLRLASTSTALFGAGSLSSGTLILQSGSMDIEFASGVDMAITGPAECELISGKLVRLTQGQATAQVPRWARGFTIKTPDVEVVDLGTRFGVARQQGGKTDVVVFEGEVDLKSLPTRGDLPFERRLVQGEAARIDSHGEMERIFQVHGDWTGNNWSTDRVASKRSIIAAVWDNLGASKSVSYYQVLASGLDEDAPAYVDHPHQWNGVSSNGLPAFLQGADYVRTVNDYRYSGELTIQVEFASDANLYVFFDDRVKRPGWLEADYEDTGAKIGLDEDAWHGNPTFSVDSGAGRSIDNTFSIWRRTCRAGEVVLLGSVGEGREARAMYGVAAVPR